MHSIKRYGDQHYCIDCQCSWDVNEDAPTTCISKEYTLHKKSKEPVTYPKPIDWENLKKALETNDWSKFPNIR